MGPGLNVWRGSWATSWGVSWAQSSVEVAAPPPPPGAGKRSRKHVFVGDRHYFVDDAELAELLYQLAQQPKPRIAERRPQPPKTKIAATIRPGVVKPVNMDTVLALEAQAKALHETEVLRQIQEIIRREREDDEDVEMLLLAA